MISELKKAVHRIMSNTWCVAVATSALLHAGLLALTLPAMQEDTRAQPVPIRIVERQRPHVADGQAAEIVAAGAVGQGGQAGARQPPSGVRTKAYPRSSHKVVVKGTSVLAESQAGAGASETRQGSDDRGSGGGEQVHAPAAQAPTVEDLRRSYAMAVREALMAAKTYPVSARRARAEGTVVLRLRVDATGRVTDATVTQPSPHRILDEAALAMANRLQGLSPPPGGPIVVDVPLVYSLRAAR